MESKNRSCKYTRKKYSRSCTYKCPECKYENVDKSKVDTHKNLLHSNNIFSLKREGIEMITKALTATIGIKPSLAALDVKPEAGIVKLPVFRGELELEKIEMNPELVIKEHSYALNASNEEFINSSTVTDVENEALNYAAMISSIDTNKAKQENTDVTSEFGRKSGVVSTDTGSVIKEEQREAALKGNASSCATTSVAKDGKELLSSCLTELENVALLNKCLRIEPRDCLSLVGCIKNNFFPSKTNPRVKTSKTKVANLPKIRKAASNKRVCTEVMDTIARLHQKKQRNNQLKKIKQMNMKKFKTKPMFIDLSSINEEKFREKPLIGEVIGLLGYKKYEKSVLEEISGKYEVVTKFEAVELVYISEDLGEVKMEALPLSITSPAPKSNENIRCAKFDQSDPLNCTPVLNKYSILAISGVGKKEQFENLKTNVRTNFEGAASMDVKLKLDENLVLGMTDASENGNRKRTYSRINNGEDVSSSTLEDSTININVKPFANVSETTTNPMDSQDLATFAASSKKSTQNVEACNIKSGNEKVQQTNSNPEMSRNVLLTAKNEQAALISRSELFKKRSRRKVRLGVQSDLISIDPNPTLPKDTKVKETATQNVNASQNSALTGEDASSSTLENSTINLKFKPFANVSEIRTNPMDSQHLAVSPASKEKSIQNFEAYIGNIKSGTGIKPKPVLLNFGRKFPKALINEKVRTNSNPGMFRNLLLTSKNEEAALISKYELFNKRFRRKVRLGVKSDEISIEPNPTLPLDTKVKETATQKVNASQNSALTGEDASSSTFENSTINLKIKPFANVSEITTNPKYSQHLAAAPASNEKSIQNFEAYTRNIKSGPAIKSKPVLLNFERKLAKFLINEKVRTNSNPKMFRNLPLTSKNEEAALISEDKLFKKRSSRKVRLGVNNDVVPAEPNPTLTLDTKVKETATRKVKASHNSALTGKDRPFKKHSQHKVRLDVETGAILIKPRPVLAIPGENLPSSAEVGESIGKMVELPPKSKNSFDSLREEHSYAADYHNTGCGEEMINPIINLNRLISIKSEEEDAGFGEIKTEEEKQCFTKISATMEGNEIKRETPTRKPVKYSFLKLFKCRMCGHTSRYRSLIEYHQKSSHVSPNECTDGHGARHYSICNHVKKIMCKPTTQCPTSTKFKVFAYNKPVESRHYEVID